jgi:16S rRNA (adenine1518-N6/adenine1519-N6)-dimethyltransferase
MTMRAKRCFSQNFLKDPAVVERIVAAAALSPEEGVFEIGPGHGVLTWRLLPLCRDLHAAEIDVDLAAALEARDDPRLSVHTGDVLQLDWPGFLTRPPYVLVANLPYNISSPVFFKILENRGLFRRMVLMFQKEFGERLCAPPGTKDYGILSVFCRQFFDVRILIGVPARAFFPVPKVDSVVLALSPLAGPRLPVADEAWFARVVRGSFAQRRKTLANSLKGAGFSADGLEDRILSVGIDPRRRGETLDLAEFVALSEALRT